MSAQDYSTTPASNTTLGDGTYIGPNMLRNKVRPALQQLAADARELYDDMIARGNGEDLPAFIQAGTGADERSVQSKLRERVSVKDFGAVGNGSTNDTVAIQAAFDSGAKQVIFPAGTYLCNAGLTLPDWLHIKGEGYQPTFGVGNGAVVIRFTQTSGVALSCGFNPVIEDIVLWSSGGTYNDTTKTLSGTTLVGIDLAADNATINRVTFATFFSCIRFGPAAYYVKTSAVEFNRCTNGYATNGVSPYNVHIDAPCSRDTTNFFAGQIAFPARNVKVIGGSIEGYGSVASGVLDFSAHGTYFETISQRAGAYGIDPGVNGASVALFGCLVYMDYTARFVNLSGLTGCALTSLGNTYDGTAPSAAICLYLPASGSVTLGGDKFGASHPNDALYVDSLSNAAKFSSVTIPELPAGNAQASVSGRTLIGQRGIVTVGLSAAPGSPPTGLKVTADGVTWDPLGLASGRPYEVIWQGDRWRMPGGVAAAVAMADVGAAPTQAEFNTLLAKLRAAGVLLT